MLLIRPLKGLRPTEGRAIDVAAPPYDVLNSAEAREMAKGKPWSFLHISKPEIDLPEGTNPYDDSVYAKGLENLRSMMEQGILQQDTAPCYYLYRLKMGEHTQTGLVGAASVEAYDANTIKKHEFTRPDKENDRIRQIDTLNAQTGPVLLSCPPSSDLEKIMATITKQSPAVDITTEDGIQHILWVVDDAEDIRSIAQIFTPESNGLDRLYIADGHHRSASASKVAALRIKSNQRHQGGENYNYFLSVIFPANQMQILAYNRVIKDLNGLTNDELLEKVKQNFDLELSAVAVDPESPKVFGMYLSGQWYKLKIKEERIPKNNPLAELDVSILANYLIEPVLGVNDPRRDPRIDFVGGIRGLSELEKRVDNKEMALAFSLYPTRMEDVMAVADINEVMPPKSTWFEPKLADGLVSHMLD